VRENRTEIDAALSDAGAVLFRGFPFASIDDFDTFVRGFDGWNDLSYDRSMSFAVRKRCSERICTTNEGKSGGLVFHHEQAQTPLWWPSKVFFCCLVPSKPGDGGATGLASSADVYQKLKARHPEFIRKCEEEGVRYTVYAGPMQDTSKGAGRSWKSFFHSETKEECEAKMRAGGWDWEWGVGPDGSDMSDEFLKCTTPVLDAVKIAPGTDKKCFFNQLIATTANALEFSKVGVDGGGFDPSTDVPTQEGVDACVQFADGTSIPLDILLDAKKMCEDIAIDVQWQKGDVALVCNYLMMHARRPWVGEAGTRQVVASLIEEPDCTSFGKPLTAL